MQFSTSEILHGAGVPPKAESQKSYDRGRNALNYLIVNNIILPIGEAHSGKGKHRQFDLEETLVAVVAVRLCCSSRRLPEQVEQIVLDLRNRSTDMSSALAMAKRNLTHPIPNESGAHTLEIIALGDGILKVIDLSYSPKVKADMAEKTFLRLDLILENIAQIVAERESAND